MCSICGSVSVPGGRLGKGSDPGARRAAPAAVCDPRRSAGPATASPAPAAMPLSSVRREKEFKATPSVACPDRVAPKGYFTTSQEPVGPPCPATPACWAALAAAGYPELSYPGTVAEEEKSWRGTQMTGTHRSS